MFELLKDYRIWQLKRKLELGDQWIDDDFLFTQWNGRVMNPDTLTKWFRQFIKKNGLCKGTIQSLRHTNATLLIAAGTPLLTVSRRLGHAQASTTSNIYAHAIRSADEVAAETIQDILHPVKKISK